MNVPRKGQARIGHLQSGTEMPVKVYSNPVVDFRDVQKADESGREGDEKEDKTVTLSRRTC
jgi:hypothetical protein